MSIFLVGFVLRFNRARDSFREKMGTTDGDEKALHEEKIRTYIHTASKRFIEFPGTLLVDRTFSKLITSQCLTTPTGPRSGALSSRDSRL